MQARRGLGRSGGFSVTEVTIILTMLTLLSGLAVPAVDDYVARAQLVRARHDVRTIGISLVRLADDVGGERTRPNGWATFDLLVGPGAVPAAGDGGRAWTRTGDGVGRLDDHLLVNGARYTAYAPQVGFGWRGAYLQDRVQNDPWGHRYSVNIAAMNQPRYDTIVLSAGPDGRVDSPFLADGLLHGGDDITVVMSTSGTGQ